MDDSFDCSWKTLRSQHTVHKAETTCFTTIGCNGIDERSLSVFMIHHTLDSGFSKPEAISLKIIPVFWP